MLFRSVFDRFSHRNKKGYTGFWIQLLLFVFGQALPRRLSFFRSTVFIVLFWANIGINLLYIQMNLGIIWAANLSFTNTLYATEILLCVLMTLTNIIAPFFWISKQESFIALLKWVSKRRSSKWLERLISMSAVLVNVVVYMSMYTSNDTVETEVYVKLLIPGLSLYILYFLPFVYPCIPFIVFNEFICILLSQWEKLNCFLEEILLHLHTLHDDRERQVFLRRHLLKLTLDQQKLRHYYREFIGVIQYPLLMCNGYHLYAAIHLGVYQLAFWEQFAYEWIVPLLTIIQISWQGILIERASEEAHKPKSIIQKWSGVAQIVEPTLQTYSHICEEALNSSLAGLYTPSRGNILPILSFSVTFMLVFLQFHLSEKPV